MKYFTPELLREVQSDDEDVSADAHDKWDRAIARYHRHWRKIRAAFPKSVQRFNDDSVCLHDAEVLSIGREGDQFVMVLQPEPPAQTMVVLTFTLDDESVIDPQALPGREGRTWAHWMYEEWDLDRQKRPTFEVLLGNGWSVKLRFRDFQYLIAQRIFPVPEVRSDPAFPPAPPPVSKPA
jgi:hypothetical protein